MSAFISIGIILLFLFAGMAAAKINILPDGRVFNSLINISLFLLLFFMGFRIGRNEEIGKALKTIGIVSITFAAASVAGTVIVLFIIFSVRDYFRGKKRDVPPAYDEKSKADRKIESWEEAANITQRSDAASDSIKNSSKDESFLHHLKEPLKLVAYVIAGFASGWLIKIYPLFTGSHLTTWLLYLLLFLIGAQLIKNNISLKETLAHPETVLLPLGTIIGSLLGGLAAAPLLMITPGKALALVSGFGWYSLSGVIITDMGDPVLGSAGFLINLMRESIALVTIPFIAQTRYPNIAIGVAGATSMDVTLPLIEKSCGDEIVPLSISSGAILSLTVPVLVPIFFQAG
ncbi:MAG: lysine exporter LysO family protein [Spirochaetia bacterium]|jgi:uncharacterized membrane protein YbjE (DUF340 family)|nr:lysine exporter LysO family protein [Spirochaetia bacterium]